MALSQGLGGCRAYVSDSKLILGEGGSGQAGASLTREEDYEGLRVVLEVQKRNGLARRILPPRPVETPKGDAWVVEDILDSRRHYGKLQYQVKRKDDDDTLTWWNTDNDEFEGAQDVVHDYHSKYPENPWPHNTVSKSKRRRRLRNLRDLATILTLSARRRLANRSTALGYRLLQGGGGASVTDVP